MGRRPSTKKKTSSQVPNRDLTQEMIAVFVIAFAFVIGISVYTHQAGVIGQLLNKICIGILGIGGYLLPLLIGTYGVLKLMKKMDGKYVVKISIMFVYLLLLSVFIHILNAMPIVENPVGFWTMTTYYFGIGGWSNGGVIGAWIGNGLLKILGVYGSYIVLFAIAIVLFMLLTGRSFIQMLVGCIQSFNLWVESKKEALASYHEESKTKRQIKQEKKEQKKINDKKVIEEKPIIIEEPREIPVVDFADKKAIDKDIQEQQLHQEIQKEEPKEQIKDNISTIEQLEYEFPSIDLLKENTSNITASSKKEMKEHT
jgi:S-DNA-T family DNA segregation ATPase FtsK/SpoIIIE